MNVHHGELRWVERNVVRVVAMWSTPIVDFESQDHFGHRWWAVDEIACSDQRFYPRQLPTLLRLFLAGDKIVEPLERWP
jgi:hypothetical protein